MSSIRMSSISKSIPEQHHPTTTPSHNNTIPPAVLSGWKEIANHLGKGIRTLQRYELELALPIRRLGGKPKGSVFATAEELDAWVSTSLIRAGSQISKQIVAFECGSAASDIQEALRKMRRLREEMRASRASLRSTVQMLSRQVQALKVELHTHNEHEIGFSPNILNDGLGTQDRLRLVCFPSHMQEAS